MKLHRILLSCVVAAIASATQICSALTPEACGEPRGRFSNIGFSYNKLDQEGFPKIHSDLGISLSKGNTYYLHKPIAGMLRFGIDAVWMDINYNNYKIEQRFDPDETDPYRYTNHQVDIAMQVGPSATVNLFRGLQASAYFRYTPALSLYYHGGMEEIQAGFANLFTTGVSVGWKAIGLGVEWRFGSSKYKSFFSMDDFDDYDDYDDDYIVPEEESNSKITTKFGGVRAYINLRF